MYIIRTTSITNYICAQVDGVIRTLKTKIKLKNKYLTVLSIPILFSILYLFQPNLNLIISYRCCSYQQAYILIICNRCQCTRLYAANCDSINFTRSESSCHSPGALGVQPITSLWTAYGIIMPFGKERVVLALSVWPRMSVIGFANRFQ